MRKLLRIKTALSLLVVAGMLFLSSCKKDDNGSGKDGVLEVASLEISRQMKKLVYHKSFTSSEIDPYYSFENYDLGSGKIKLDKMASSTLAEGNVTADGLVSLSFTTSFPKSDFHLHRFLYHTGEKALVTPDDLRTSYFYLLPFANAELTLDAGGTSKEIYLEKLPVFDTANTYEFLKTKYVVICAEEAGEIKGINDDGVEYNMKLKKGWNIVRISGIEYQNENKKYETVDNIPTEAFFYYAGEDVTL
jgi:hypothetical protein